MPTAPLSGSHPNIPSLEGAANMQELLCV